MTTLKTIVNNLNIPDGYIELFELDATNLPGGSLWRFSQYMNSDGSPIVFDGNTYVPLPIYATGFNIKGDGSQANPQLIVANTHRVLVQSIVALGDLVGSILTRIVTLESYVDGGANDTQPEKTLTREKFYIQCKIEQTPERIVFDLCSPIAAFGKKIPNRLITRQGDSRYCKFPGVGSLRRLR